MIARNLHSFLLRQRANSVVQGAQKKPHIISQLPELFVIHKQPFHWAKSSSMKSSIMYLSHALTFFKSFYTHDRYYQKVK